MIDKLEDKLVDALFERAVLVEDQQEASEILRQLIACSMEYYGHSREEAERIIKSNLGYYAGYYSNETRERVERLFDCEHPVFGKIAVNGPPSPEKAFQMGVELGEKLRKEKELQ